MYLVFQSIFLLRIAIGLINYTCAFTIPFEIIDNEEKESLVPFTSFLQYNFPLDINNYLFVIKAALGTPPQKILLKLSSRSTGTWIYGNDNTSQRFNFVQSSTYSIIHPELVDSFGKGMIGQDILVIEGLDYQIDTFPFFLIQHPTDSIKNVSMSSGEFNFGLEDSSFNQNSSKYSFNLLNYLYEKHEIDRRLLVLSINDASSGSITIGKYPDNIQQKKLKECLTRTNKGAIANWSCTLKAVYFDDNRLIPINQFVDISIGGNAIMTSESFFYDFVENYFHSEIMSNKCKLSKLSMYIGVCCDNDYDENKIGMISFVFKKWTLKLESNYLFKQDQNGTKCSKLITRKDNQFWFISPSVLLNHYTIFDKDTKKIGFYPKK